MNYNFNIFKFLSGMGVAFATVHFLRTAIVSYGWILFYNR